MKKLLRGILILLLVLLVGGVCRQEASAATEQYMTWDQAVEEIKQQLKLRNPDFTVYVDIPYMYDPDLYLFYTAMDHTGVPTEGDYLLFQYEKVSPKKKLDDVGDNLRGSITYSVTYRTTAEQEKEIDAAVQRILDQLDLYDASDVDKAYGIHDYICSNVVYDYNYQDISYSAYGAIINNRAVCQGYTLMFYRLALELGIDNRILATENHGMNMVRMEGKYYIVDTTWDAGNDHYEYFLLSLANYDESAVMPEGSEAQYPMGDSNYCGGSGTFGDGLKWVATSDGTLTISGNGDMPDYSPRLVFDEDVMPPWTRLKSLVKRVVISDGITGIGTYAFFEMENLMSVELPGSLKKIGRGAFGVCGGLKLVHFSGSQEEWERISIDESNVILLAAELEFGGTGEDPCGGDHQWGDWVVDLEPTCTEEGTQSLTCSRCGKKFTEALEPLGHLYGEWYGAEDFDCTVGGTARQDCQRCDLTNYSELQPTTHNFYRYVSDGNATLESDGTKTAKCINLCCTVTDTIVDEGSKLLPMYITSDVYEIKVGYYYGESVGYVFGVTPGTTKEEFLANIHQKNASVYDLPWGDGDIIKSSMIVSLWSEYMAYADWEIVVTGDVNCDGLVTMDDLQALTRYLSKEEGYYGYIPAMDYDRDGVVTIEDAVQLRAYVMGKEDSLPTMSEGATAQITGPSAVTDGGTFTVSLTVQGSGILSVTGTVMYDDDKLEFVSIEYPMDPSWEVKYSTKEDVPHYDIADPSGVFDYYVRDEIRVAACDKSLENPIDGSAGIVNLTFRIKDVPVGKKVKVELIDVQLTDGTVVQYLDKYTYRAKVVAEGTAPEEPTDPTEPEETVKPTKPSTVPTEPSTAPTEPSTAPTEPSTAPTEPSIAPTEPSIAPTEPSTAPTEPSTAPTEPSTAPTEPSTAPTEPSTVPTEPSTAPTEPSTAPTEPTTVPTEPTTVPTEPTTVPTEPTTVPMEPGAAPTEPSDPEEAKASTESSETTSTDESKRSVPVWPMLAAGGLVLAVCGGIIWFKKRNK